MDFRTPPRDSRYTPRRTDYRGPAASVPPAPERDEPVHHEPPAKKRRLKKSGTSKKWKWIVLTLILAGFIIWLAHGYISTKNQLTSLKSGQSAGNSPSQQLIDKVGKLVVLPSGEAPTIATVNDASKLKSQQFFANAKNGDKVLIFSKSGKGLLYRPSTNQVVEYTKVNLTGSAQ